MIEQRVLSSTEIVRTNNDSNLAKANNEPNRSLTKDKSESTGRMSFSDRQDAFIISPDYQAVKTLTTKVAEVSDTIEKLRMEKLSDIRRKVQEGFYLNDIVLSLTADKILKEESKQL